jgi:hypothetical protein
MFRALICSSSRGTAYTTIGAFYAYYVGRLLAGLEWNWQFRSHVCKMYITWLHQLSCVTHIWVALRRSWLYTWKCTPLHGRNNNNVKKKTTNHCFQNLLSNSNISNSIFPWYSRAAFLKLWSSGSALVVLLDWTLVQKRQKNINGNTQLRES